jgi:single-strand DNA-binding protein
MPSFNQVLLMGNVTRDPQLKTLPNGSQVADFGLAVNRKYRTAQGEDKEETCFVDCTAFGKQAEVIGQYCAKGKPLFIEGRLKFDTWEDKAGGKRSKLSVVVNNFQFVGGREQEGGGAGAPAAPSRGAQRQQFTGADIPY